MRIMTVAALALLGGCATSSAGLYNSDVEKTITSAKTSEAFAMCVAETLIGNNPLRSDGDHYWVVRMNGYGLPTARWDFTPLPNGGSQAELRASISVNTGDEKVQACA